MSSYEDHIEYRDGPAGRRAALVRGPDVWEVVSTEPDVRGRAQRIAAVAEYLRLSVQQVSAAFDYYDDHRAEIDAWVAENGRVAHKAYVAWSGSPGASHH